MLKISQQIGAVKLARPQENWCSQAGLVLRVWDLTQQIWALTAINPGTSLGLYGFVWAATTALF